MNKLPGRIWFFRFVPVLLCLWATASLAAENQLIWDTNQNRVSANFRSKDVADLLARIAAATGWQVYLEPGITHEPSAKFSGIRPGEALRLLLGNLNFALVPQTNGDSRLYVFRTSQRKATQLVRSAARKGRNPDRSVIRNELIVRLRPGAKIEELARLLGAKITGRIDALNTYRLEFPDEAAAEAARELLMNNQEVIGVDSNFSVKRPATPQQLPSSSQSGLTLEPKEPDGPCRVIIGLIDGPVSSGSGLDPFLLSPISVAGEASPATELTHGTAMAEAILRSLQTNIVGNKASPRILPVDVYGSRPTTTTFQVGEGIYQAVKAGANIINLSLGGSGDSPFLHGLIAGAARQGVIFFSAAGNEPVTTPVYPAAYPEVIAVTASDPSGQVADYANRGSFVSIMAPGTSMADFEGRTYLITGTSSATAMASGFAAGLADSTHNCPDQVLPIIRNQWGVQFDGAQ